MREFATALAFLTRVPVPVRWTGGAEEVGRGARYFPLIGLLLGGLHWSAAHLPVPALAAAVCIAALDALATGALHLDGLSDMADGFGGGHTRDDVLRIMRDHQIGAYGATALVLVLLLRIAAWQELIATHTLWPLLLAPCAGRWATVCLSWRGPYARPSGTGAVSRYVGRLEIALATLTGLAAAFGLGQWRGLLLCLPVPVCAGVVLLWARRRIGGVTGDVIGAATIVSESLVLLLAVARW